MVSISSSSHHRTSCRGEFSPVRRQTSSRGAPGSWENGLDHKMWTDGPEPAQQNRSFIYGCTKASTWDVNMIWCRFSGSVGFIRSVLQPVIQIPPQLCILNYPIRPQERHTNEHGDPELNPGLFQPVAALCASSTSSRVPLLKAMEKVADSPGRLPTHHQLGTRNTSGEHQLAA